MEYEIYLEDNIRINKKEINRIVKNFVKLFKIPKNNYLSIAFVSPAAIRKMNKQYRGIDKVTDILSFSATSLPLIRGARGVKTRKQFLTDQNFLGEIIICYQQARRQAKENDHTITAEINQLLAHGLVHLMGYDHKTIKERKEMGKKEQEVLRI
jgi:probable rRNA maturation factor